MSNRLPKSYPKSTPLHRDQNRQNITSTGQTKVRGPFKGTFASRVPNRQTDSQTETESLQISKSNREGTIYYTPPSLLFLQKKKPQFAKPFITPLRRVLLLLFAN